MWCVNCRGTSEGKFSAQQSDKDGDEYTRIRFGAFVVLCRSAGCSAALPQHGSVWCMNYARRRTETHSTDTYLGPLGSLPSLIASAGRKAEHVRNTTAEAPGIPELAGSLRAPLHL